MDVSNLPDLGFSWDNLLLTLQTSGVDFAFNLVKAIAIFYFGKLLVGLIVRTLRKIMLTQDIEDTLENFVLTLVRRCGRFGGWPRIAGLSVKLCVRRTDCIVQALPYWRLC
jgi:hypothetical protein